jgi:hypothetical protein
MNRQHHTPTTTEDILERVLANYPGLIPAQPVPEERPQPKSVGAAAGKR